MLVSSKKRDHLEQHAPAIPVADSMYAVTGEVPSREPTVMAIASTQYASVDPSKSSVTGSRRPANFAMEYKVLFRTVRNVSPCIRKEKSHPVVSRNPT